MKTVKVKLKESWHLLKQTKNLHLFVHISHIYILYNDQVDYTLGEESACLTIKKVEEADVGSYTLRLKNPIGEASAEMTLIIMRE